MYFLCSQSFINFANCEWYLYHSGKMLHVCRISSWYFVLSHSLVIYFVVAVQAPDKIAWGCFKYSAWASSPEPL